MCGALIRRKKEDPENEMSFCILGIDQFCCNTCACFQVVLVCWCITWNKYQNFGILSAKSVVRRIVRVIILGKKLQVSEMLIRNRKRGL